MENEQSKHQLSIDDIIDAAVSHLEAATTSFGYIWEEWFGNTEAPECWSYGYHEISAHMTSHMHQLSCIVSTLTAACGIGRDVELEEMQILLNKNQWRKAGNEEASKHE